MTTALRLLSPADKFARMTRFPVCHAEVGVYAWGGVLHLVALAHQEGEPFPRITANTFADATTPGQLRALADHIEAVIDRESGLPPEGVAP